MKLNQKGVVDLIPVIVLVVLVAAAAFTLWQVNKADETVSNTAVNTSGNGIYSPDSPEESSSALELATYTNTELGFSLSYPSEWGEPVENRQDRRDTQPEGLQDGITLHLDFPNYNNDAGISIFGATQDWFVSKGPIPITSLLNRGYAERDGSYYLNDFDEGEISSVELTGAMYIEELEALYWSNSEIVSALDTLTYNYIINTSTGGLVLSSPNTDDLELMEQIAATISIL